MAKLTLNDHDRRRLHLQVLGRIEFAERLLVEARAALQDLLPDWNAGDEIAYSDAIKRKRAAEKAA
jgi:hypothetical protein